MNSLMNKIKALLLITAACLLGQTAQASLFKAQEFTLSNGLHCVIIENHKAPLVMQMVWYKAGSTDEQAGKGGSAHLLEHLMFRGSKYAKDGEFNRITEKYGVEDNAFTTHDVTVYHQFADISKLEVLLALEADRMANLNFSETAFEAERKIVYQERMQRVENNPSSPFYERLRLLLWGNSPYGQPVTGLPHEIMGLKYSDIMEFYNKFYTPSNAVLVLSGDITAEAVKPLLEKYYGSITSHNVKHQVTNPQMNTFHEMLEMALPEVSTIKVYEKYLLPKYTELKNKVYDYLVLAEYLGGSSTSALYKDLVKEQKTALSVSASYSFVSRGESVFSFSMVPQENEKFNREEAVERLQKAIKKAMAGLTEEKLSQIKRKMLADLVFINDNPQDAAGWVGAMLAVGLTLQDALNYENNIQAVTIQGIKEAFDGLQKAPRVSGILLPEDFTFSNEREVK